MTIYSNEKINNESFNNHNHNKLQQTVEKNKVLLSLLKPATYHVTGFKQKPGKEAAAVALSWDTTSVDKHVQYLETDERESSKA